MTVRCLLQVRVLPRQLFDHLLQMQLLVALVLQHLGPLVALGLRRLQVIGTRLKGATKVKIVVLQSFLMGSTHINHCIR